MSANEEAHQNLLSRIQSSLNDFYKLQETRNKPSAFDDPAAFSFSDWIPSMDIRESSRRFQFTVDVPGIDPKNIEVTVEDGCLAIRGERKAERNSSGENYRLSERSYGSFERRLRLPATADPSKVSAKSSHGTLVVTIGKRKVARQEKIPID